ncbi:hypothetical protein AB4455_23030 [Vibrio sp. 10N.261.46.E12]|uniref:hypothetical protein n=1 Tax=unclassified Vibrio TaxID=2614977 RepID=UPI0009764C30|nr:MULTISPECIES: hypothetical protein [unclassified Vibrio]OMO38444.1 hypothetical protein BH584_17745 [Vibrio sp. 10N.261.45.E1]PMJ36230.1 hypothetical protein BCU27_23605 [Vibrio sp. 10N.286.45.B6]PML84186.1 hypothetical protein BCT66_17940 [Vibrio sp. 10N.261.49.E11]PMM89302.1 hypothetical protein BCT46_25225 [Vibrio sp. 10N.261.46.E8]PMN44188.1 hypothetical protein BCT32_15740 [Vibrio sp. 10N.261.45.E11]
MKDTSRRDFFKYSLASATLVGTGTYSKDSHAIAFTAAAIAAGEQIGWSAKPFLDGGEMFISKALELYTIDMNSKLSQGMTGSLDLLGDAQQKAQSNDYQRRIQPLTNPCSYNKLATVGIKRAKQTESTALELNSNRTLSAPAGGEVDISFGAYTLINSNRVNPLTPSEAQKLKRFFQAVNTYPTTIPNNQLSPEIVSQKVKRSINTSVLNYEMARIHTNRNLDTYEKVRTTYQSKEWRNSLNESSADISLAQEVVYQKATHCQLLFELLVTEQNLLVAECINALTNPNQ